MQLNAERLVPKDLNDPFYLEHIQRYQFAKKYIKEMKVLDLGCGAGYGSFELKKLGAKSVVGIDNDSKAIEYAISKFKIENLKFKIDNATNLSFPDSTFDIVVSFEVIEHIKDYRKYLKEVFRVLKKGGYFIFSTPNAKGIRAGTSPYHFKEFTARELKSLMPIVKLYGQFFSDPNYIKSQKDYFKKYNKLTFGGNKLVKKLLHLISPEIKSFIFKLIWPVKINKINNNQIKINSGNLNNSITLIGFVRKA